MGGDEEEDEVEEEGGVEEEDGVGEKGGVEEEDRFQCARTYLAAALYFAREGEISLL